MNNLILFVNSFLSYILLMIIIAVVAAIGFFFGLKWNKAKNAEEAFDQAEAVQDTESETE